MPPTILFGPIIPAGMSRCRVDEQLDKLREKISAAIALRENGFRDREFAFRCDSFVLFGDAFDAVAWIVGISVRGRNEMANFVWTEDC